MTLSLDEIFNEEKYDRILFYLKERGIADSKALESFNFAELSFVPGVTENLISEVRLVFQNILSKKSDVEFPAFIYADSGAEMVAMVAVAEETVENVIAEKPKEPEKASAIHSLNKTTDITWDASVEQIFTGVPHSAPFVRYCLLNGKRLMSQLSEDDFDAARSLHGIGTSSAIILHDTYLQFYDGEIQLETAELVSSTAAGITIEKLFGNQPHGGLLIRHCHSIGIHTMADLSEFSFCAKEVNGIGTDSMEKLKSAYLEMLDQLNTDDARDRTLPDFPDMNRWIKLSSLVTIGLPSFVVARLSSYGYHTVKDLHDQGLSTHDYFDLRRVFTFLLHPITMHFENKINSLGAVFLSSLLQRSQGETLQAIANKFNLTRERIRQVVAKSCYLLLPYAEMVAQAIIQNRSTFESAEIQSLFKDVDIGACCLYVLRESTQFLYIKFSDKYVETGRCLKDIEQQLYLFADEVIGDGLNFFDNLEHIEEALHNYNLGFFDFEDIMSYLVQAGYRFYGDYVTKGKTPYAIICYDAIFKYFLFDIKLDADEKNSDLAKLRNIIQKHYYGLKLPENNRALTAGITRNADTLILSGRGRYCPIEKIIYSIDVMDHIYAFIQNSAQTSFYYNELFAQYQGRLLAETSITNANFLHGMLMHMYPNDFTFERDLLVKNGEARKDINDRLCELIISNGMAMTKEEIRRAIPGVNDFVIAFSAARLPRLIQWEYNSFNHMDNIRCTSEEVASIHELVENGLMQHYGYMSEYMLYNAAQMSCPQFIEKNSIRNSLNLYFVSAYLLRDSFRFRRPHILSVDFPVEDLSVANIARELLHCNDALNYCEYTALASSVGWAVGTQYSVFSEIERDFVRIDENNYVRRELFHIDKTSLMSIINCVELLISDSGYYAISSIFTYRNFPECDYEWNGFLLSSVIDEYQTGFKVISPQVRDRRYLRGVLLHANEPIYTFEDLIMSLLKKEGITELNETDMIKYLKMHGLVTKVMPQELYECEMLLFKNEIFTVK